MQLTSAKDDSVADHVEGIFLTLAHKLREGRTMIEPLTDPSNPDNRPVSIVFYFYDCNDMQLFRCEFCTQAVWQPHLRMNQADAVFDQASVLSLTRRRKFTTHIYALSIAVISKV